MNRIDYDELFCYIDDFCKGFEPWYAEQLLSESKKKRRRNKKMSLSEMVTVMVGFYRSGMSCFKYYYEAVCRDYRKEFPCMVHYARFVKLIKNTFVALMSMLKGLLGEQTQYMFVDGTPISVCHVQRRHKNKVFKGIARLSKTSVSWFFGLTPGNACERKALLRMADDLSGKLFGDKGYISKELFKKLFEQNLTLYTKLKKGMKQMLIGIQEKIMLLKRGFIETVFSSIKGLNIFEHHRHRSVTNAFCHWFSALISYQLRDDKPSLEKALNFIS